MKKILLLVVLIIGMLFDYRLVNFKNGLNTIFTSKIPDDNLFETIKVLSTADEIIYYDDPFGEDYYCIINSKSYGILIFHASENDITALKLVGYLSSNLKPKHVTPIPVWVYGLGAVLIIFFPTKKRRVKKNNENNLRENQPV